MASYNHVVLMGNLTRDPELKYLQTGQALANLGMAVSRKWRGADDQIKEEVTFVDIVSWGKAAEAVAKYMTKGSPVLVEGTLREDRWENDKGEKKSKIKVNAISVQFLPRPDRAGGGGDTFAPGKAPGTRAASQASGRPGMRRAESGADDLDTPLPDPDFDVRPQDESEEELVVELN